MGKSIFLAALFCALVISLPPSFGQATDANLVGTVLDDSGAALPNADVDLQNLSTGFRTTTHTNATGEYRFNNIPVGRYKVTATAHGFTPVSLNNVSVELNRTSTANLTVHVGPISTTVDVRESSVTIDTTTAQVQSTYDARQALTLPMTSFTPPGENSLGALNLSLLSAGVSSGGGIGVGYGPSVGGQRPRNNSFNIDGTDNNRKDISGPNVYLPNEATENFTLLQNQFAPEFGHSSGGQFNLISKSGSNDFHGSLYEYFQNRNLNAVDQTNANQGILSNPRYDQNRFGGTIGGPIKRDKLFFFANYEFSPLGQVSTESTTPVFAPTAAGYATLSGLSGISQTNLGVLKQYLPAAASASDSTTVRGVSIPIGVVPVVGANYTNQTAGVGNLDYNISERDQLRGRFVYNKITEIDNSAQLPAFFVTQPTTAYLASITHIHTFTPNLTNELRLGYNRFNQTLPVPDFQFPGLDAFPNIEIDKGLALNLGPDSVAPQATIFNTYQLVNNVSWTRGKHTLKFGFDGRKLIAPQQFTQRARGEYEYGTLEQYLLDLTPDVFGERSLGSPVYYGDQFATYYYANDDWRIRHNLSLNLGLRYEYTTIPFSQRSQSLNSISSVPGVITFAEPKPQKTNFAPRIGIAYSPGTSGRTSIRAGFGMAYDVLFDNIGLLSLPPQFTTTHDVDLTSNAPGFLANGGIPANFHENTSLTPAEARALTANYITDQKLPYSIQWNIGVQHNFHQNYVFEARYLGTRGVHLITQSRLNSVAVVTPDRFLPTYLTRPSQASLNALPLTLNDLTNISNNSYEQYGFENPITAYLSRGNSIYHGLALQLDRRFSGGLQLRGSYTWSHLIDDSAAEFFSTQLSPRRPQDFQNMTNEKGDSALDRRHRLTVAAVYDTPWYKGSDNWFLKNVVGNYLWTGSYTFESPEYATIQSNVDSNLNGDSAGDRTIINPNGVPLTGSSVTALTNSAGQTVAYLADNPNAQYIVAGAGALANAGKNTFPTRRINNINMSLSKRFSIKEASAIEFGVQAFNIFNHPQYIPGSISTVYPKDSSAIGRNYLVPGDRTFGDFTQAFSSNPRSLQLVARFTF